MVAALLSPNSLKTNSAITRPWTLSLWAVRRKLATWLSSPVRAGAVQEGEIIVSPASL